MFVIGVRDDLLPIRAYYKLIGQVLAASVVIFLFDLRIRSGFGFLGIYELPEVISYIVTFLAIVIITNSFNLIDGLDGLAGSIACIVFMTFGVWFFLVEDRIFSILAFALLGSILAFLIFNWQPSKIFMGDTGSLFLGLTLSIFTIHFIDVNGSLPVSTPFKFQNTLGMAACFVIIPLVDTFRIIILRLLRGQSPFTPDKRHVHHAILRLGLTHSKSTLVLMGVQILFISIGIIFSGLGDLYIVPAIILLSTGLSVVLDRLIINRVAGRAQ
jgi:UDP-N-acetylmuramyl pentapeptide phosphotransferase/UDP-N-acetylglucosamine-1-phosphate transferase